MVTLLGLCQQPTITNTDDGGLVIEWLNEKTGRFLLIALPEDKSICYFTAREAFQGSQAGIITEPGALIGLLEWLDKDEEFPTRGIELG